ncbi:MAG TPA: 3-oxoacyl-ACP reductase family protein [Vicinamibacteria bacterium]|nr:3-oxoacyl-ACP reductase family protein [Vicinamibacteria bacterium]
MLLSLDGRKALVTGGSRGIGRAVGLLFARLGARVALGYVRDEAAARQAVSAIEATGGFAVALQADLAVVGEAQRLVSRAEEALSGLDVLVVNHGIWKRAPIDQMTAEQWDETLRVNLTSVREACAEAARRMLPRGRGAIVLVASTAGQRGEPFYAHYAASKGAVIALTRSLASELGSRGIRVNCVAPGWVRTDMSREAIETAEGDAVRRAIPLGRPGAPEEIAGPIAFLASDLASYLHGLVLPVNGGAVMAE